MKIKVYEANNHFKMGLAVGRQNINLAIVTIKKLMALIIKIEIDPQNLSLVK